MTRSIARSGALLSLALSAAGAAQEAPPDLDETRAAWQYRREVVAETSPFAALSLPPELLVHAQPDVRDLRLLRSDGTEVPYVVDRLAETDVPTQWKGTLVDTRQERRVETQWTADLGQARTFDALEVEIASLDFAKRLRVEASDDVRSWRLLRDDAGVFDRMWDTRIHHTRVELPQTAVARYLRLTADDRRSAPIAVTGLMVSTTRHRAEQTWTRAAAVTLARSEGGVSRYRLEVPAGLPFAAVTLAADDPAFARRVALRELRSINGRLEERNLADGRIYHLALPERGVVCESLRIDVGPRAGGELLIDVYDGDSPRLRGLRASVSATALRLLFPSTSPRLTLYYGNARTHAPLYDIAALADALRANVPADGRNSGATLSEETANPRFRATPLLPYAPTRGAALDVWRWKVVRPLTLSEGDDLYTLTLAAADLPLVRPDLADVRLADAEGRQVPFILELNAATERVPLAIDRSPGAGSTSGRRPSLSRYRLSVADGGRSRALMLPLQTLELGIAEPFFRRHVLLTAPASAGARERHPRMVFSGDLARDPESRGPITLDLQGARLESVTLEIDEGDNAPLTLTTAQATVSVPRLAFKATSGPYRLLLGNSGADSPRYDLAALRQQVLCYSARVVRPAAAAPNPGYRRGAAELFRDAPPTVFLWAVLIAAVLALLLLTARVLRHGSSQPPDGTPST
jgi:hypothetical protein